MWFICAGSLLLSVTAILLALLGFAILWNVPEVVAVRRAPGDLGDALTVAMQLGRLDVVTLVLAALTVVIGFGALAGFWMVRREAIARAEEEARSTARDVVDRFLKDNGKALVVEALKADRFLLAGSLRTASQFSDAAPDVAEDVASSFDGDDDG